MKKAFVTRKIVNAACRIAAGPGENLRLGDVSISRDWDWAPEAVRLMVGAERQRMGCA